MLLLNVCEGKQAKSCHSLPCRSSKLDISDAKEWTTLSKLQKGLFMENISLEISQPHSVSPLSCSEQTYGLFLAI